MGILLFLAPDLGWKGLVISLIGTLWIALFLWYLATYLISPLRKIPGPFLAGWTNLWRAYHVTQGRSQVVLHELHQKYGPVVRIAPNVVDLDLPELVKTIYNTKGDYRKTEFYHGSSAKNNGRIIYNLFSECDPEIHARQKRPIAKHYSLTGVLALEPHIDQVIRYFCQRLEEEFIDGVNAGTTCKLDQWLLFYTWDVVGKATFSEPIGYLEKGYDFDRTIAISDKAMDYFSLVGQLPILDHLLDKNPVYRMGPPAFGNITNISIQHLVDRLQGKDTSYHNLEQPDFLDRFIEAKEKYPDIVDDGQIISYLMINMIAGADTTAITLNAAIYFALKNPRVWARLQDEVLASQFDSDSIIPFNIANALPYLNAVIREAMRMHPGVAMTLERYVPRGGLSLPNGQFIPQGCIVGMNPYVIARNQSVWGEDADVFRPERWLRDDSHENEEEYQTRLRLMNNSDLTFGAGSRICIGRHLGLLEVYKVMATLVSRYNIELADPHRDWKTHNSFFVRQEGIDVKLSRRS
ncbi:cytochrome P450 [Aspergillus alliaceus]|uniref:cytochrome P450 n=1 Tax=Petromyces alliaceus TaxID=209559 RepID=UPI0012A761F5|nr:cytochrome P450 [Aspergillus alliaceus]KAB8236692.1 cytochrome P450 [Aspergillus alliaceus]